MPNSASPRALIRHAVVRVLDECPDVTALLSDRVFGNRMEHWLIGELPAAGVYTLSETVLESDISPDPMERRITLGVELLAGMSVTIDDTLDTLALAVENALTLPAIGAAMTAIVNEVLVAMGEEPLAPVVVGGIPRTSIVDTLLTLKLTSTEIGIAIEGDRQIGVAALAFDLEYTLPDHSPPLPDFLLAATGWDVAPPDGIIDMESRVVFDPPDQQPDTKE